MTQHNTIYEDLVFRDDKAQPGLKRTAASVSGIAKALGSVKAALGGVGGALGLAGMFQVASTVGQVSNLYERVRRLRAVTGMAAADAHALTDAFELTGTDDAIGDRVITRLAALSQRAQGAGTEAVKLRARLRAVGVDLKGGVTDSLLSMSEAVKSGKLGVAEMARTFKIPLAQSAQLMGTLRQGPARLRAIINETKAGADLVDDAALASFEKMQQGKRELADAWEGLVGTVYKQLLPGVTTVVRSLKSGFDDIQPVVEQIGSFLSTHMNLVVTAAKAYLGYMVAARAVAMTGGNLPGMLKGQAAGLLTFKRGANSGEFISRKQGLSNLGGGFAAAGQLAAIRMQFAGRSQAAAGITMAIARVSPLFAKIAASAVSLRALGLVIARFTVVGTIIAAAVTMFRVIKNDIGGHRTRIAALLNDIVSKFKGIGSTLKPVLDGVSWVFGKVLMGAVRGLLYLIEYILYQVNLYLALVKASAYFLASLVTTKPWNWNLGRMWSEAWDYANKKEEARGKTRAKQRDAGKTETPAGVYQDFRGSKFSIENKFAEGFDIGRVSVAITDGIGAAAQRRVMSNTAPLFAVRGRA